MNGLKRFTRRITWLFVIALGIFAIPFLIAKLVQWLGLLSEWNDMYGSDVVAFWVTWVITRALFGYGWVIVWGFLIKKGGEIGFLWREPYGPFRALTAGESVYQWILTTVLVIVFAESAIVSYTGIRPAYMP